MIICNSCKKPVQKLFTLNLYTEDHRREACAVCCVQILEPFASLIYNPLMIDTDTMSEERALLTELKKYLERHPDEALESGQ